mgnify:FL=1
MGIREYCRQRQDHLMIELDEEKNKLEKVIEQEKISREDYKEDLLAIYFQQVA